MTDRLPAPEAAIGDEALAVERASATSARIQLRSRSRAVARRGADPRTLRELQTWFVDAITSPDEGAASDAETIVTPGARLSERERLEIYRAGYRARLVECLADDYPVLAAALGEETFEALAWHYVDRHPSSSPNLNPFGRHMAELCRDATAPGMHDASIFFSELASLEWALVEVVHAESPPPFDLAAIEAVPVEARGDVRFVPSPSARLLRFSHPVNAFLQTYRHTGVVTALPEPGDTATAVYRRDLRIWRMDLTPAMSRVLFALFEGATLGDALARIGTEEDPAALAEAARSVMVWFREWVKGGLFAGFG